MNNFIIFILIALLSHDSFTQWFQLSSGTSYTISSIFMVNPQTGYAAGNSGVLLKTTNGGINWISLNPNTTQNLTSAYFFNTDTGVVCGYSGLIFRTVNGGLNWLTISSGVTTQLMSISFSNSSYGLCAGNNGTLLMSSDRGASWSVSTQGLLVTFYTSQMINQSTGFAAGINTIFSPFFARTSNSGFNWSYTGFYINNNEASIRDIFFFDAGTGYAVSYLWNGQGGISFTTNGGYNWTSQIFGPGLFTLDFPSRYTSYAAGGNGTVIKSTDGGVTWLSTYTGTGAHLYSIDFTDTLIGFAAGENGTIIKTTTGGITYLKQISSQVPKKPELNQNFPNPFNPLTNIIFSLPDLSYGKLWKIQIKVFDVLGRCVADLIRHYGAGQVKVLPGTYKVSWDASGFESGVYFCQLYAVGGTEEYSKTIRMIFLK